MKEGVVDAIIQFNNWASRGITTDPKGVFINFLKKQLVHYSSNLRYLKSIKSSTLMLDLSVDKKVTMVNIDTTYLFLSSSEQTTIDMLNSIFSELGYDEIANRCKKEAFEKRVEDILWSIRGYTFGSTFNK